MTGCTSPKQLQGTLGWWGRRGQRESVPTIAWGWGAGVRGRWIRSLRLSGETECSGKLRLCCSEPDLVSEHAIDMNPCTEGLIADWLRDIHNVSFDLETDNKAVTKFLI
jgi:hypothetical protein